MNNQEFTSEEKEVFYTLLKSRRDVRSGFTKEKIPDATIQKILSAAHHAPSVGFMQPWNFILVRDENVKAEVKESFLTCRQKEAELYAGSKRELYDSLKLEGIEEAPLNILVTCERNRSGESGLGRSAQENMDLFSTVCAIQNMWLAARVEGLGMGWVSIVKKEALRTIFKLPENVEPVAYLCLGFVDEFSDKPELEKVGWEERLNLDDLVFDNSWGNRD
ncbi:MAG: 5,6-dimethylbenzimidazole synthase [Lentisphaeraceae bacterium]|nr:5,6-dimethylbenzimidazole synthase [Lentisphaeraceae bacterium]